MKRWGVPLIALLGMLGLALAQADQQPIRVDPNNPRVWTGLDGKPILFLQHSGHLNHHRSAPVNWQFIIAQGAAQGINLHHVIGWDANEAHGAPPGTKDPYYPQPLSPYKRVSGFGKTLYDQNKLDLDQLDDAYFQWLSDVCAFALSKGVYIKVQIWSSFPLRWSGPGFTPWGYKGGAFTPENTITHTAAYGFPPASDEAQVHELFAGSLANKAAVNSFKANAAVDDAEPDASKALQLAVRLDGREVWRSRPLRKSESQMAHVGLPGSGSLTLAVEGPAGALADWGGARFTVHDPDKPEKR